MAALAVLLVTAALLLHQPAEAQQDDKAPSNLALTSPNPGELVITWDAPTRAPDDYRVTWKKSDAKWPSYKNENTALGGNAFPTGTSHTVTGLEEGTAYKARVRARYHDGNGNVEQSGPWSDPPVELTTAALPAKPTGLSTSPSHDSVLLAWTDPGDSGITGYQVLRGPDAANLAALTADTGSATTSYTDDTVEAETTYVYAIRARNIHGLGPQSDAVPAVTTAAPAPPAKPTGLSTSPSHDSVLLAWTDPGDSGITGYQVLRGPDAANLAALTADTGSATTSYTDDTVEAETTYVYAIRARNTDGLGPQSDTVTVTTPADPVLPAKPTGLIIGSSHNSVILSWTDPDDDSITGYQILRGLDADNLAVLTDDTGSTSTSHNDDTVEAAKEYAYAIRARNAGVLSPQSDTVTVTTQAAPEELVTELALAGADFTLDGKTLDTTGTCSESNIGSIPDACTINIETKSPVFAVDGTLDSDDRINIRTGRDKAAVDASSAIADESDLRGDDQTVDLTFPEGRSLLRVWGDEDDTAGGEEEHFFRVNVAPYWEWNGNRLSKDSNCQSTSSRTADQVTDDDCIVTQSGNAALLRFHNVINEQFKVHVDVNGAEVIREPDNTALDGSFTLDVQDGDNVVRIRLAAKGGAAETYGSNAFYYKVTATDVAVSNLGQDSNATPARVSDNAAAVSFTTGGNPDGYEVSAVRLSASISDTNSVPQVSIHSNSSGEPGSSLKVLTNPASTPVSATPATEVEFGAGDYPLAANTTYWIVLDETSASGGFHFDMTTSTSEDADGAPGWEIGDSMLSFQSGSWATFAGGVIAQIAVKGELATVSDDATLSGLSLKDASDNVVTLDPTFASDVESYTAAVAAAVSQIKVELTGNDDNAIIDYLDGDDMDLTDADTNTTDVFDVALAEGENVFKVKVTAEDGTTTKTYTVTVTRQEAPNSPATGRPSISGMLKAGHTLTASTSNIRDDDGLSNRALTFQWVRVDGATETNISGADAQVHTLTVDDVGFRVKIVVRLLDDRGELETVESMANPASGSIQAPATGR